MFIAVNVIWIERMTLNKIGVFVCLDISKYQVEIRRNLLRLSAHIWVLNLSIKVFLPKDISLEDIWSYITESCYQYSVYSRFISLYPAV